MYNLHVRGFSRNYIRVLVTYLTGTCKEYQSFGYFIHRQN